MSVGELRLEGCRPEPLGAYLKALGVLRLVGEQADPDAKGCWQGESFLLRTSLDANELSDFFVDGYRPTPIVTPWNKGSGLAVGGKSPSAEEALDVLERSVDPRLAAYRDAIASGRGIYAEAKRKGWLEKKEVLIEASRARLPDEAVSWLDATAVLTEDGASYPPLLGTGGNLGRLDLSSNFVQRLADVLCLRSGRGAATRENSRRWVEASLFGRGDVPRMKAPVGQFDPGGAGGVNSSPSGRAEGLVNPWDFVLLIEGSLLFASAAARRLGSASRGRAAAPFMVAHISAVGYASRSGREQAKGEVWAPLWSRPATAAEVAHLIGEGRSEWRGRQARSGLDMVRATASLGVDRGIDAFARHVILERDGQNPLAVPAGLLPVRPKPEVPLLSRLDPWLDAVRGSKDKPAGVERALHRAEAAIFEVAVRGGPARLQTVLVATAGLEAAVGRAAGFRQKARVAPIHRLPAEEWLPKIDDGSPELRLAAALASQHDEDGACLRCLLRPVRTSKERRLEWSDGPAPVAGFGVRPVLDVLADALVRRVLTVQRRPARGSSREADREGGGPGVATAFRWRIGAPLDDVSAFVAEELDDARLGRLLAGLLLLDWSGSVDVGQWFGHRGGAGLLRPAWAVLGPFFHGRPVVLDGQEVELWPQSWWPARLVAGEVQAVVGDALRRLRMARLDPAPADTASLAAAGPRGRRLAAALLCPLTNGGAAVLLRRTVPEPIE